MTDTEIDYRTLPLEDWTFADYRAAMGTHLVADVLKTTPGNVRMMSFRGIVNLDRMSALYAEVSANEDFYRRALVAIRSGKTYRAPRRNPQPATV